MRRIRRRAGLGADKKDKGLLNRRGVEEVDALLPGGHRHGSIEANVLVTNHERE